MFERKNQIKSDEKPIPAQYVFAARSDNALSGERDHPFPPDHSDQFSAGFWLVAPSKELYAYLMSVMGHFRRFDPNTMEQSLLNYAFRQDGAMPWKELSHLWSATWPSEKDLNGGVATLHEKFWKGDSEVLKGTEALQAKWWKIKASMEEYFSSHPT
jgi:alpha-N-acetylglucosamine transferase